MSDKISSGKVKLDLVCGRLEDCNWFDYRTQTIDSISTLYITFPERRKRHPCIHFSLPLRYSMASTNFPGTYMCFTAP